MRSSRAKCLLSNQRTGRYSISGGVVGEGGGDLWRKIALAKKPSGSRDGYERILVAEPGEIGKLPAPEWRGSSKNDGRRGPALIK